MEKEINTENSFASVGFRDENESKSRWRVKDHAAAQGLALDGFLEDNEPTSKRAAKASVFTNLFSKAEYTFQLYKALHPEDEKTTKDEITLMTIESHMLNQQYNDLGFMVGDRLIILAEAQSTWSENIVVRCLLYVVQTWYKYIKRKKLDVYDEEIIKLPVPELYVIYTGTERENKPDRLTLKDSFFEGNTIGVDCEVKVLYDGAWGDIINQYVRFCHIFNEQVKLLGRTREAVDETIRICKSEAVLEEYLEREQEEIMDMMLALFDEETIMTNHDATIERKGINKGRIEGRVEEKISLICRKLRKGKTIDEIADDLETEISFVENVCKVAEKFAPDYDEEKVIAAMLK